MMIINPFWGSPIKLGLSTGAGNSGGRFADQNWGSVFTATQTGTANYAHINGSATNNRTGNYRLAVYAATGPSTWGSLIGHTADQTRSCDRSKCQNPFGRPDLDRLRPKICALLFYHSGSELPGCGAATGENAGYSFSDTFSDGAAASAGTLSSVAGGVPSIWLTNS